MPKAVTKKANEDNSKVVAEEMGIKEDPIKLKFHWALEQYCFTEFESTIDDAVGIINVLKSKFEPKPELATEKQLDLVRSLVDSTGTDLVKMLQFFKVDALPKATKEQATKMIDMLKLKRKKEG